MDDPIHKIETTSVGPSPVEYEQEKHTPQKPTQEIPASARWQILHFLILQRILPLFPKDSTENELLLLREHLKKFSSVLLELKRKDLSQDPSFLLDLSHEWNRFLDSFSPLHLSKTPQEKELQKFFSEIQEYPQGERYSLGYYLSEAAGEKWIPFPFINLLHLLYEEHQKNPQNSQLRRWETSLQNIFG
jgi:hypothetical protein